MSTSKPRPLPIIHIDSNIGSRELFPILERTGALPNLRDLEVSWTGGHVAPDALIIGRGVDDEKWLVAVERKTVLDMVNSAGFGQKGNRSRFAGSQLKGLLENFHVVYLFVEGQYRMGSGKQLQVLRFKGGRGNKPVWVDVTLGRKGIKPITYNALENHLETMALKVRTQEGLPLRIVHTSSIYATCHKLSSLAHYWTSKSLDQHQSHDALYAPVDRMANSNGVVNPYNALTDPNLPWKWAAQLRGFGAKKAKLAGRVFKSGLDLANASVEEWMTIQGVGKKMAKGARKEIGHEE